MSNSVKLAKIIAESIGKNLPGGERAKRPYAKSYRSELDTTPELDSKSTQHYQQLIGFLRWEI